MMSLATEPMLTDDEFALFRTLLYEEAGARRRPPGRPRAAQPLPVLPPAQPRAGSRRRAPPFPGPAHHPRNQLLPEFAPVRAARHPGPPRDPRAEGAGAGRQPAHLVRRLLHRAGALLPGYGRAGAEPPGPGDRPQDLRLGHQPDGPGVRPARVLSRGQGPGRAPRAPGPQLPPPGTAA